MKKTIMEPDWLELWSELVSYNPPAKSIKMPERFASQAKTKSERPDPLLNLVLAEISMTDRVIDIGAGSGRWTLPLARAAFQVTAVEPSPAMQDLLKERISAEDMPNVTLVSSNWEEASLPVHDISVCSQAMYTSPDLSGFVHKMEGLSRKKCFLAVRLPPADGIIAQLSAVIHGLRHDSPNAVIAFNALYSLGIYPDVQVEKTILKWRNQSFEDAFVRAKRHLRLGDSQEFDGLIRQTLKQRLVEDGDNLIWPDGMRSALLSWEPGLKRDGLDPESAK